MKIVDFEKIKKFTHQPDDTDTMQARFRELDWLAPMINDKG